MKRFISFEGIDGSGKSTVSKLVYKKLKSDGYDVIYTFEPTNSEIGVQVQKYIKEGADPFVISFTFIADRILHGKQIKKWLEKEKIVICDRYAESTYSYQGAQLKDIIKRPMSWLQDISENKIPIPDRTFLFIIDPEISVSRIKNRDYLIPFEKVSFLKKVQKNYLDLSVDKRFLKIDATKKIEEITKICYDDIMS
ncbi:MAG: dTMP kinase [Candidatus Thermoplasmatota archaeon]|nr:dTMP kinase [Candidatus Thermoplasmatota archaeon]